MGCWATAVSSRKMTTSTANAPVEAAQNIETESAAKAYYYNFASKTQRKTFASFRFKRHTSFFFFFSVVS